MTEMLNTSALTPQRTRRFDRARLLTSGDAGKIWPLKFIPLFREDQAVGRVVLNVQTAEKARSVLEIPP